MCPPKLTAGADHRSRTYLFDLPVEQLAEKSAGLDPAATANFEMANRIGSRRFGGRRAQPLF
jgi:hypothetical protein